MAKSSKSGSNSVKIVFGKKGHGKAKKKHQQTQSQGKEIQGSRSLKLFF